MEGNRSEKMGIKDILTTVMFFVFWLVIFYQEHEKRKIRKELLITKTLLANMKRECIADMKEKHNIMDDYSGMMDKYLDLLNKQQDIQEKYKEITGEYYDE